MSLFKDKHLHHLKQAALGMLVAATVLSCTENKTEHKKEYGMFAYDKIKGRDIYGNTVELEKVSIAVYKDEEMTPTQMGQLYWGTKEHSGWPERYGETTHAELVQLNDVDDEKAYVEVYDDGILKDNQGFVVKNGRVAVLGDKKNYETNLVRYRSDLNKKKAAQEKLWAEEQARARAIMYRNQQRLKKDTVIAEQMADTAQIADTLFYDSLHRKAEHSQPVHSVADTLLHSKGSARE